MLKPSDAPIGRAVQIYFSYFLPNINEQKKKSIFLLSSHKARESSEKKYFACIEKFWGKQSNYVLFGCIFAWDLLC